jgi:hypothetical protein
MSSYSVNNLCDVIFKCKQILVVLTNDGGACGHTSLDSSQSSDYRTIWFIKIG